uniref:Uncharacterized protein n=1 Tax=Manihot esculenta TaxID=3983 RepID=A0A2C9VYI2_MANES
MFRKPFFLIISTSSLSMHNEVQSVLFIFNLDKRIIFLWLHLCFVLL